MERIYPLTDDHLQHVIGMPVCAVMKNGLRYVGIAEGCRGGRLALALPSYGHGSGHQPAGQAESVTTGIQQDRDSVSEQITKFERTSPNKKSKSVRGKKQQQQAKASSAAKETLSTNYASGGHNPAENRISSIRSGGNTLNLDDIFLLFLIV